jgi:hypothetical protein
MVWQEFMEKYGKSNMDVNFMVVPLSEGQSLYCWQDGTVWLNASKYGSDIRVTVAENRTCNQMDKLIQGFLTALED